MTLRPLPFLFFFLLGGPGLPAQTVVLTEDFSGGIPDSWTVQPVEAGNPDSVANALWLWTDNDGLPGDGFWIDFYHMASPSKDNGFAIFAGAYLDSGGPVSDHPDTVGSGPAPQPHVSDLISPVIDCSGLETVALTFHQELYRWGARSDVGVSTDGGESWEYIAVNPDVGTLALGTKDYNSQRTIDLTEWAAGQDSVRVAFRVDGYLYYWMIDDVIVSERPEHDMVITDVVYPLTSYAQPLAQLAGDTLRFGLTVGNQGLSDESDVVKKVSILDDAGNVLFADSLVTDLTIADLPPAPYSLLGYFLPDGLTTGSYTVRYEVYIAGAEDFAPTNNVAELPFIVTDSLYAKEYGEYWGAVSWAGGSDGAYRMGNVYHTGDFTPGSQVARRAFFGACCNPMIEGISVPVRLYQVDAAVADDWSNFDITSNDDLTLRGYGEHLFTAEEDLDMVAVDLFDLNSGEVGVLLEPNSRYFLVAELFGASADVSMRIKNVIDYEPLSTVFWGAGWDVWFISEAGGPGGLLQGFVPVMQMEVGGMVSAATTPGLAEGVLRLSPNPAREEVRIEVDLARDAAFELRLLDGSGRMLRSIVEDQGSTASRVVSLDGLPAGLYFVQLATTEGRLLKKLVVLP